MNKTISPNATGVYMAYPTTTVLRPIYRGLITQVNNQHTKVGITTNSFANRAHEYGNTFQGEVEFVPLVELPSVVLSQIEALLLSELCLWYQRVGRAREWFITTEREKVSSIVLSVVEEFRQRHPTILSTEHITAGHNMSDSERWQETLMTACELCNSPGGELIWQDDFCRVVLLGDKDYPAYCRVELLAHIKEMTDLPPPKRAHMMKVVFAVEMALREIIQPDKINLASLGNKTPHLHWHVIPRFKNDKHFPNSHWGDVMREGQVSELDKATKLALKEKIATLVACALNS